MPELPEVETVARGIAPFLNGQRIAGVKLHRQTLRVPLPEHFAERLEGRKITMVSRRAKYVLIHLNGEELLVIHLGMSGRLLIHPKNTDIPKEKHDHVLITLDNGTVMRFNDPRRFGLMALVPERTMAKHVLFQHLGPEPLAKNFTGAALKQSLTRRSVNIKTALMNQEVVVGVGNIYASESLHLAKISPLRAANTLKDREYQALVEAIKITLKSAIESGGSTLRDFVRSSGEAGYFQHHFSVYGRAGLPCLCPAHPDTMKLTPLIVKIVQQGRSTFYCTSCQK